MKTLLLCLLFLSLPFTFNCNWGEEKVIGNSQLPNWEWAEDRMKYHGTLVANFKDGEWYFVRGNKEYKLW